MATDVYTKSNKNFVRAFRLLIDVGTSILRKLFEFHALSQTGVSTLDDFLKNNRKYIRKLVQKNSLQQYQYDVLFPTGGVPVNIAQCDISLLCILLKECCTPNVAEKQAMNELRKIRNTIFAHKANTSLDDNTFQTVWKDIEKAIAKMLSQIGDADLTKETMQKIADIKQKRIDDDEETLESIRHQLERLISLMEEPDKQGDRFEDKKRMLQTHLQKTYIEYSNMMNIPLCPLASGRGIDVEQICDHAG